MRHVQEHAAQLNLILGQKTGWSPRWVAETKKLIEASMRTTTIDRKTGETDIHLTLALDGRGEVDVTTGIGFLDHMLTLFAHHGLFDLAVQAAGDLHVDTHHTVEDVAICLGQALDRALGDRAGIIRTAHSYVPMDEALGFVAVDLSGRPYAVIEVTWHTPMLGAMDTDLVRHFLGAPWRLTAA